MERSKKTVRLRVVGLIAAGLAVACAPASPRLPGSTVPDVPLHLRVRVAGRVQVVPLEEYVLGAALSEAAPAAETDAVARTVFRVQAIVARTYAAAHLGRHASEGFDLCDQTHCQLYEPARLRTSRFSAIARDAVADTAREILRFRGRPAEALFHSDCGGHTTTPTGAWGGPALLYLPAAPDDVPEGTHRQWQLELTATAWTDLLRSDTRTDAGGQVRALKVTRTDGSGRAAEVEITGGRALRVAGAVLRTVVTARLGPRSLMSTRFEIRPLPTGFRLVGTGFGHGVGLCQVGAMARARRGDSARAILAHYYPGAG